MRNFYIIFSIFILIFFGCSKKKKLGEVAGSDSLLVKQYDTLNANMWRDEGKVVLYSSKNNKKIWELFCDTLINNTSTGLATTKPLNMNQYDSLGNKSINILAKKGFYNKKTQLVIAVDSVHMKFSTGIQNGLLKSDSLVLIAKKLLKSFPVKLNIFKKDTFMYRVVADSGEYIPDSTRILLNGNIYIKYVKNGIELYGNDLLFDGKKDIVKSNGHVKFRQTNGTFIEGDGFISDQNFNKWRILKNIKGEVKNVSLENSI